MPTISNWDLFFVKNELYGVNYFKYDATLPLKNHLFCTYINKNLFNDPPIEIFIISIKILCVKFKRK